MPLPGYSDQVRRQTRIQLDQFRSLQSKWEELSNDGLTSVTAAVNTGLEIGYSDLPTHWPPALLAFHDLKERYVRKLTVQVYDHLQALDHILFRLSQIHQKLTTVVETLDRLLDSTSSTVSSDASKTTDPPIFRVAGLRYLVNFTHDLLAMYQRDLKWRQETLTVIPQLTSRSSGVALLSAWLNSVELDKGRLLDFKDLLEFELDL
ncbi:hypothetical protein IWQ62_003150 [Dispira parvispora]|uniref:Uncharacterized protein n=1 Tax=Dispira parvispora TaxID=1520584 RepID=A0A9W8APX6_9FUNG|nr:hypothetical protein IWQ62_003150 [Dispira parvispora]